MRPTRILETILYAEDTAAMRGFYEGVLGLPVHHEVPGHMVFFKMPTQMLLVFNPKITSQQKIENGPPPHGATGAGHVCFRCGADELDQWRAQLAQHGVAIEKVIDWPRGGRSIYFRDPAGNSLEFSPDAAWALAPLKTLAGQKIVVATHNKGKLEEFQQLLAPYGVNAQSAGALGLPEPAETENTFKGNARIKAESAQKSSGLIAVSDDSGLCVDALEGAPGVYTADWAGPTRDWMQAMRLVEEKLQAKGGTTPDKRRAQFKCTLCVMWPDGETRYFEGVAPGTLTWPPRGTLGHGYDPMFEPDGGAGKTFAEMTHDAKNLLSHRGRALEKLLAELF
jgi:non-canonical purine NTP pyrophosphatase (RdgB/HAM1 family)